MMHRMCLWVSLLVYSADMMSAPSVREKYPHTILTDDYGLIPEKDIVTFFSLFTFDTLASPPEEKQAYPYYQCFLANTITMQCENSNSDEQDGLLLVTLGGKLNGIRHEYYLRRLQTLAECRHWLKQWEQLLTNQEHACLAGAFRTYDEQEKSYSWIWERLRTKKGYVSYLLP